MTGRQHRGDENGDTQYQCATISYNGKTVSVRSDRAVWSSAIQESGKNLGGVSKYTCPTDMVMVGRSHSGDENGDTQYQCAPVQYSNGNAVSVNPQYWSYPLQESGKDSGGLSRFECPSNQVIVGRQHSGDENGQTAYLCAKLDWSITPLSITKLSTASLQESGKDSNGVSSFTCPDPSVMSMREHLGDENGTTIYTCATLSVNGQSLQRTLANWSKPIQESGKNSEGSSSFSCPYGQVLAGRQHTGDENGNTSYRCAYLTVQGEQASFYSEEWGNTMSESSSFSDCPSNQVLVGRTHWGDENGNTRYLCARPVLLYQSATLPDVVSKLVGRVGTPSTTSPSQFASRADMGVDEQYVLHFDVGGEGYHDVHGVRSGFAGAININAQTTDSQNPNDPIPLLLQVPSWGTNPPYPLADHTVSYLTLQGAPLTDQNVNEMVRVLRVSGLVGLWIDPQVYRTNIDRLASQLGSTAVSSETAGSDCFDEFQGNAGFPKTCIRASH